MADAFHRNRAAADGRQSYCKACMKDRYDPKPAAEYQRKRLADPEKLKMHRRAVRRKHLKRRYGISLEEYESLLLAQSGRCALCTRPIEPGKWLPVDHCHSTGAVRGLLCSPCNRLLARFEEDRAWMVRADTYLNA